MYLVKTSAAKSFRDAPLAPIKFPDSQLYEEFVPAANRHYLLPNEISMLLYFWNIGESRQQDGCNLREDLLDGDLD
jgi:hypothetical protein